MPLAASEAWTARTALLLGQEGVDLSLIHIFQKRVNISPVFYRHQHTIVVFALIKGVYIVKIEIHDMDLGMVCLLYTSRCV